MVTNIVAVVLVVSGFIAWAIKEFAWDYSKTRKGGVIYFIACLLVVLGTALYFFNIFRAISLALDGTSQALKACEEALKELSAKH